jgi:UDP-N-acetylmuramyl tripeptide synthase
VDENSIPIVLSQLNFSYSSEPKARADVTTEYKESSRQRSNNKVIMVLLNLFRDQLDRYGEVDVIAEKWEKALRLASLAQGKQLTFIFNADDPLIAHLGKVEMVEKGEPFTLA